MSLYEVTAPMTIRYPDGSQKLIIHYFQHPQGLLFFEPWWHTNGLSEGVHLIKGGVSGEGPWNINSHIITITGCQGSDSEMATLLADWQAYLATPGQNYPQEAKINFLARKLGVQPEFI